LEGGRPKQKLTGKVIIKGIGVAKGFGGWMKERGEEKIGGPSN
jgi:hypothetical protein